MRFGAGIDVGYYDQLQSGLDDTKTVLDEIIFSDKTPTEVVEEKGLKQISDTSFLEKIADALGCDMSDLVAALAAAVSSGGIGEKEGTMQ